MTLRKEHPLHNRRSKSNKMLGLVLGGFVMLVFAITIAKMTAGHNMEAADHVLRPALTYAK